MHDHASTRSLSFYRSPLVFLQHIPWNHSSFQIMYMIIHLLGWGQHTTSKSSTPSFIGCLDDFSLFFQNRKSGFCTIRILITYITEMQLHGHDELGILQYISEWAKITDHSRWSHVLSLYNDLELEVLSTDGHHLIC